MYLEAVLKEKKHIELCILKKSVPVIWAKHMGVQYLFIPSNEILLYWPPGIIPRTFCSALREGFFLSALPPLLVLSRS